MSQARSIKQKVTENLRNPWYVRGIPMGGDSKLDQLLCQMRANDEIPAAVFIEFPP